MKTISSHFLGKPHTRLGWWSVWLEVVFVVMFSINVAILVLLTDETFWRDSILPFYAITMLVCGLAGGVVGSVTVIRQHERSLLVWLAILNGLFVLLLVLNELWQGVQFLLGK
jgi:uncharacterized membrane protein YfcA